MSDSKKNSNWGGVHIYSELETGYRLWQKLFDDFPAGLKAPYIKELFQNSKAVVFPALFLSDLDRKKHDDTRNPRDTNLEQLPDFSDPEIHFFSDQLCNTAIESIKKGKCPLKRENIYFFFRLRGSLGLPRFENLLREFDYNMANHPAMITLQIGHDFLKNRSRSYLEPDGTFNLNP